MNANIRVQDLPTDTDQVLNAICAARECYKWELVREALVEFAENHKDEINKLTMTK